MFYKFTNCSILKLKNEMLKIVFKVLMRIKLKSFFTEVEVYKFFWM